MSWGSKSSSGTSSSKSSISSQKFGLNEDDKSPILVYRYRSGSKSLEVSSQQDLCKILDADPNLPSIRVARKKIPRTNSRVEVCGEDLFAEKDRKRFCDRPTVKSCLANVGLPPSAYWKNLFFNSYPELYIISKSPSSTPNSSANNSPEASQHVTPSTMFPRDHLVVQDHS